ncbi:MAG: acyl carrier protein [Filifactoraceae bacterium]
MIFDKIVETLVDYKGIDGSAVKMDSTFAELELDSLDTVELVMTFEEEFGVSIEMNDDIKTIGDLVKTIEELRK